MRTRTALLIGLVIAILVLLGYGWYAWQNTQQTGVSLPTDSLIGQIATTTGGTASNKAAADSAELYPAPSLGEQQSTMQIGGKTLYVDLAENNAQQALGLGNRTSLGADQGMLFIFSSEAQHQFWMKDMSFAIDMIWLSDDGTVIYIQPNVSPSTYPNAFGPHANSRYVLEVSANYAAANAIQIGNKAILP